MESNREGIGRARGIEQDSSRPTMTKPQFSFPASARRSWGLGSVRLFRHSFPGLKAEHEALNLEKQV